MLKPKNRLKNSSAFIATYHQGHVFSGKFLKIYLGKQTDLPENNVKIGFVVSTKVHKRAVIRNRIKRHAREIIRKMLLDENIKQKLSKYMSIVIVAKQASPDSTYFDLEKEIKEVVSSL